MRTIWAASYRSFATIFFALLLGAVTAITAFFYHFTFLNFFVYNYVACPPPQNNLPHPLAAKRTLITSSAELLGKAFCDHLSALTHSCINERENDEVSFYTKGISIEGYPYTKKLYNTIYASLLNVF